MWMGYSLKYRYCVFPLYLPFLSGEWLTVSIIGCPPNGMGIVKWISGSDNDRFPDDNEVTAVAEFEWKDGSITGIYRYAPGRLLMVYAFVSPLT